MLNNIINEQPKDKRPKDKCPKEELPKEDQLEVQLEDQLEDQLEIYYVNRIKSNKNFLVLTSILFTLFMLSEIGGALESNSLSLLGDAMAMSIDVANYITNIYIENLKKI
jgi:Co/Zn/Cd efflux system component